MIRKPHLLRRNRRSRLDARRPPRWLAARMLVAPAVGAAALGTLGAYGAAGEFDAVERKALGALTYRVVEHFALATAITTFVTALGVSLAVLLARVVLVRPRRWNPPVLATGGWEHVVPAVSALILLGVAAGVGPSRAILAVLAYGLVAVLHTTVVGLGRAATAPPAQPDVAAGRHRGTTGRSDRSRARLRPALPAMFTGVRTAFVLTVAAVMLDGSLGGLLPGNGGLGAFVDAGISRGSASLVVVGIAGGVVLALAADWVISLAQWLSRGREAGNVWKAYPDLTEGHPAEVSNTLSSTGRR